MLNNSTRSESATILIGDSTVTINLRGSTRPTIAGLLGVDLDSNGQPTRLYLDRLIHTPAVVEIGGWATTGAISTILTRE